MTRSILTVLAIMTIQASAIAAYGVAHRAHNHAEIRKCYARELNAFQAHDESWHAWEAETQRAQRGLGCRDNMTSDHVISED